MKTKQRLINSSSSSSTSFFKALVHPTFKRRKIVGGRKNRGRQRVPQITCVWKEAGTISLDARVANLYRKLMRGRGLSSIAPPAFWTRNTIVELIRTSTKIVPVKEGERSNIAAQLQRGQLRGEMRCINEAKCF